MRGRRRGRPDRPGPLPGHGARHRLRAGPHGGRPARVRARAARHRPERRGGRVHPAARRTGPAAFGLRPAARIRRLGHRAADRRQRRYRRRPPAAPAPHRPVGAPRRAAAGGGGRGGRGRAAPGADGERPAAVPEPPSPGPAWAPRPCTGRPAPPGGRRRTPGPRTPASSPRCAATARSARQPGSNRGTRHPTAPGGSENMRFGVNYTPSRGWFHHWLDFDLDEVRADLDPVAALGLDHIRVFPLWPLFQPNRALIRPRAVGQLVALADAARERGLDVSVDGLQGHLSSFDFLPSWNDDLAPPQPVHRPVGRAGPGGLSAHTGRSAQRPAELPRHDPGQRGQPVRRRPAPRTAPGDGGAGGGLAAAAAGRVRGGRAGPHPPTCTRATTPPGICPGTPSRPATPPDWGP